MPSRLFDIVHDIEELSERDLASFAAEARRRDEDQGGYPFFFRAAAETAERQRDIKRAKRKNKGIWYARLSVTRWDREHVGTEVLVEHERCETRKAAVDAARRLLVEHAGKFDELHTVEADLLTELEWQVMGGDDT